MCMHIECFVMYAEYTGVQLYCILRYKYNNFLRNEQQAQSLHGMTVDGTVTSVPVVLISEGRPKRVEVQYKYWNLHGREQGTLELEYLEAKTYKSEIKSQGSFYTMRENTPEPGGRNGSGEVAATNQPTSNQSGSIVPICNCFLVTNVNYLKSPSPPLEHKTPGSWSWHRTAKTQLLDKPKGIFFLLTMCSWTSINRGQSWFWILVYY